MMHLSFRKKKQRKCMCCGRPGILQCGKNWFCEHCMQEQVVCCICKTNPVKIVKDGSGYCPACFEEKGDQEWERAKKILWCVIIFTISLDLLGKLPSLPILFELLIAAAITPLIWIFGRKLFAFFLDKFM